MDLVPDHCNEADIALKQVTNFLAMIELLPRPLTPLAYDFLILRPCLCLKGSHDLPWN